MTRNKADPEGVCWRGMRVIPGRFAISRNAPGMDDRQVMSASKAPFPGTDRADRESRSAALRIITDLGVPGKIHEVSLQDVIDVANRQEPQMTLIMRELISRI